MRKPKETKPRPAPKVGIIYIFGGKLLIDSTPLGQAGRYGDCAFHERDHISYWAELVKSGRVPNSGYEEFPRGRVSYDRRSGQFTFLADLCILRQKSLVSAILSRMHLPVRGTKIGTDGGYRCISCVRREPLTH